MEQEQILSILTEQLGQTSLSQRTISDYVSANLPAEGQEFDFERHAGILRSLNGNYSADMKKAVEDFKKNYKPEPPKPNPREDESKNDEDSYLKRLEDKFKSLESRLEESERKNRDNALRKEVAGLKDSLKVANANLWNDCVANVTADKDDTAETLTEKAKSLYEKKLREYFGTGATPYNGNSGDKSPVESKAAKEAREAFKQRMRNRGRLPKT